MQGNSTDKFFESKVLGHPSGLFVLFFTEMWERFSYYGMRALLVLFLTSQIGLGGWDWDIKQALALYGTYTAMVYLTPILGGYIADQIIGYRRAVVIGALLMTLGHGSMALENETFMYIGIALLIFGNGFFKPNMTSIISHMYKDVPEKKDGAYTIFYMGVNAGAFLGIMLCGFIGVKESWSYGFGLAGIFMLLGMLQFSLAQNILGSIGLKPTKGSKAQLLEDDQVSAQKEQDELDTIDTPTAKADKGKSERNPFTLIDKILIGISALIAVVWIINDPVSKINGFDVFPFTVGEIPGNVVAIIFALILFFILLISRIIRYRSVTRDKMIAVVIFASFTVFFWAAFEQAGGTMTIFASQFTERIMSGGEATTFIILDIVITVVPIAIISWVLFKLFRQTIKQYFVSNLILGISFLIIWGLVFWKIDRNLKDTAYMLAYQKVEIPAVDKDTGELKKDDNGEQIYDSHALYAGNDEIEENAIVSTGEAKILEPIEFRLGQTIRVVELNEGRGFRYLDESEMERYQERSIFNSKPMKITEATVTDIKKNEVEIEPTWFGILNSLFIIMFAPLFSRLWESKWNPSGPVKYGLGLILLGIGFGALALGAVPIGTGEGAIKVSVWWLTIAYLFHTLGELCLSPVGLSYVSKLVPGRMIAFMFGVWYLAIAIGNKLAGLVGGEVEAIAEQTSYSQFFLIFTLVPGGIGALAILLSPVIKKFMHGVR